MQRLSRLIRGMQVVGWAAIGLAVLSVINAWQRPVSALAGISLQSATLYTPTGEVLGAPAAKYAAADLQLGDVVVRFAGVAWADAQRLNLHELPPGTIGDSLPLVLRRGDTLLAREIRLQAPNPWEQLVLLRLGLSGLVCAGPPTYVLLRLRRRLKEFQPNPDMQPDETGVPLWILTWYGVSIMLSLGSFKQPVLVLGSEMLARLCPMLVAITTQPYPLAARAQRNHTIATMLLVSGVVGAGLVAVEAHLLAIPNVAWPWNIAILRYETDPIHQGTRYLTLLAAVYTFIFSFIAAASRQVTSLVRRVGTVVHWRWYTAFHTWMERTYPLCPPSLFVIAVFQFTILLLYALLDMLRVIGWSGGGYSTIFAAIPVSYMLLYSDTQAQIQGRRLIMWILWLVVALQSSTLVIQAINPADSLSAYRDSLTIALISFGTIFGVLFILLAERGRRIPSPVQRAIDAAFTQTTLPALWQHFVGRVGPTLGVEQWLWIKHTAEDWITLEQTHATCQQWLLDPRFQHYLRTAQAHEPYGITINSLTLPITLIIVPIFQQTTIKEVLVTSNPTNNALLLIDNPNVYRRLADAVKSMRLLEQEQQFAQKMQLIARASIHKQYQHDREERIENTRIYLHLHGKTLKNLNDVVLDLERLDHTSLSTFNATMISTVERHCRSIDAELRTIIHELHGRGINDNLMYFLDDVILEWERKHRHIRWVFVPVDVALVLSNDQKSCIFLLIEEAVENALKHANPRNIAIRLHTDAHSITTVVTDDGCGFRYEPNVISAAHLGVFLMTGLAEHLDGHISIDSRPNHGCTIRITLPLQPTPLPL